MSDNAVQIHSRDNVAVVTRELEAGDVLSGISGDTVAVIKHVPRNHKVAITYIAKDAPVIKYGEPIGRAQEDIKAGEWVHTHNLVSGEE